MRKKPSSLQTRLPRRPTHPRKRKTPTETPIAESLAPQETAEIAHPVDSSAQPEGQQVQVTTDPEVAEEPASQQVQVTTEPEVAVEPEAQQVQVTAEPELAVEPEGQQVQVTTEPEVAAEPVGQQVQVTSEPEPAAAVEPVVACCSRASFARADFSR